MLVEFVYAHDMTLDEVLQALKDHPNDLKLLQKAGELFQRRGDDKSAAKYFAQIADLYTRDGYQLKAVALLKQVLRLDPDLIDILAQLATIHISLGLDDEANSYFLRARIAFLRAGRRNDALEMERRLAERSIELGSQPIARA